MASIVILEHRFQASLRRRYLAHSLAVFWRERGHRVVVHAGRENLPAADLALLHVDLTVVPEPYRQLLDSYPRVLNAAVLDVSKRRISRQLVTGPDDAWHGPVVVKTDANYGGLPEQSLRRSAGEAGVRTAIPDAIALEDYPVFPDAHAVPSRVWSMPELVVERFLPERDSRGFYMRHWTFLGDRERSNRYRAAVPIMKSSDIIDGEPVPVPDEIRAWRDRLGFDFGKFDYVVHDGRCVLLDVNRTPGSPDALIAAERASFQSLADGIGAFLR
jgi:hypothetical protein